jgi:hypothetical protein
MLLKSFVPSSADLSLSWTLLHSSSGGLQQQPKMHDGGFHVQSVVCAPNMLNLKQDGITVSHIHEASVVIISEMDLVRIELLLPFY